MTKAPLKKLVLSAIRFDTDAEPVVQRNGSRQVGSWLFDIKSIALTPEWMDAYAEYFWNAYGKRYPFQVGGVESAGTALTAAIVAKGRERGTPVNGFFIRKNRKEGGFMKRIEGLLDETPIILVDDIVNSGESALSQVLALASTGRSVDEFFSLVQFHDSSAYTFLTRHGVKLSHAFTLADFSLSLARQAHRARDTFREAWVFQARGASMQHTTQKSAPLLHAERLYLGVDSGEFFALSPEDGHVLWRYATQQNASGKGIFSSPAAHGDTVVFGAYDGVVYALSAQNGAERWAYRGADWVGSSPMIAPALNTVYIGLEFAASPAKGGLVALEFTGGDERWVHRMRELVHASPLYVPETGLVYIGDNSGAIEALDAEHGVMRWSAQVGGAVKGGFAFSKKHGLLLCGSFDGSCSAHDARTGKMVYAFPTHEPIFSTPLIYREDIAIVGSLDKYVYAFDVKSGARRWRVETGGRIFSTAVCVGTHIFVGSNDGILYEIEAETGRILSLQQFAERIVNRIAFSSQDTLFVATADNALHALTR